MKNETIISYPDLNDENWKKIKDWEDYYIHPSGFVKSVKVLINKQKKTITIKEKILKMFTVKGYLSVNLVKIKNGKETRKSARVHRLVAESFLKKINGKTQVNHKDRNKLNSNINNLEWCTPSENEKHSYKKLGKITNGIKRRKIPVQEINKIKKLYKKGITQKEIANKYKVDQSTISNIIRGKTYVKHIK